MDLEILLCGIVIVYTILIIKLCITYRDGFTNERVQELYKYKELFNPTMGSYKGARDKIKWLDPVIYYESVKLYNSDNFTPKMLNESLYL